MDAVVRGREDLGRWLGSQPSDLFDDDRAALALMDHHSMSTRAEVFHHAGRVVP